MEDTALSEATLNPIYTQINDKTNRQVASYLLALSGCLAVSLARPRLSSAPAPAPAPTTWRPETEELARPRTSLGSRSQRSLPVAPGAGEAEAGGAANEELIMSAARRRISLSDSDMDSAMTRYRL